MTDRDVHDIERSLTGIKVSLATLSQKVESHLEGVDEIIGAALSEHEAREFEKQQQLLIGVVRWVVATAVGLISAIGTMAWWIFQHLLTGG